VKMKGKAVKMLIFSNPFLVLFIVSLSFFSSAYMYVCMLWAVIYQATNVIMGMYIYVSRLAPSLGLRPPNQKIPTVKDKKKENNNIHKTCECYSTMYGKSYFRIFNNCIQFVPRPSSYF